MGQTDRFGLVLGAGGSLAWVYHLGVLEGLRDSGLVDPDRVSRVVGTSAGAAVGAAMIAGTTTEEFLAALAGSAQSGFVRSVLAARGQAGRQPDPHMEIVANHIRGHRPGTNGRHDRAAAG